MKVLVVNAGSSSLKFTFFRMSREEMMAKGIVERIGLKDPHLVYKRRDGVQVEEDAPVTNHDDALRLICGKLVDPAVGVVASLSEVEAIGHRVVHGAEKFRDSVRIDGEVRAAIHLCSTLAPLHNPPNLGGVEACERAFPGVANVAVFDTAFHQTMAPEAYLYAVPYKLYEDYGIRKYGFHGTSHKFVAGAAAEFLNRPLHSLKLITCHLGNGCSAAAVRFGRVIDTSMGMTPLMGLVMGTRCGDIDPGVLFHLLKKGMTVDDLDTLLNKKSGLRGVAEIGSGDMRDILAAREAGTGRAASAFAMFVHRLVFYIGGYHGLLDGADALVFTGGIGENSVPVRAAVIARLAGLGCRLDAARNQAARGAAEVSTDDSTLKAIVIPTNEELMIARETVRVLAPPDNRPA